MSKIPEPTIGSLWLSESGVLRELVKLDDRYAYLQLSRPRAHLPRRVRVLRDGWGGIRRYRPAPDGAS